MGLIFSGSLDGESYVGKNENPCNKSDSESANPLEWLKESESLQKRGGKLPLKT